ncbi:isoleucine--tRNA ligase [candidate division KSB1 bacterium]
MYKKLPSQIVYPELEKEILKFWKDNNIFARSVEERPSEKPFIFYEGPPTANGQPGVHHVISRTIKDLICRYKTMQGYRVARKAGWDTHGLPVEIEIEKELGLESKEGIIKYGVGNFNEKCKESVFRYKKDWDELTERIGFWLDLDNPYITYHNDYIETVWWILDNFFRRDLIYKGHKILPYCSRCGTPLSSHEVSLGYRDISDPSIYVKAKVKGEDDTYILLWTTTPWTLISNVALAINPFQEYIYAKTAGATLILVSARKHVIDEPYEIVKTCSGSELIGMEYEQIFPFLQVDKKAFYVIEGDFVTIEDGTGVVHIAPAFGEDDYNMGQKFDLPLLQPVDEKGAFVEAVTPYKGLFVKDADPKIIADLKKSGQLYKTEEFTHSYPHCWRCDTPLLYYARQSWYIKTTQFKDRLLANNKEVWWQPKEVGEGRFHQWLENNVDWSLSRDRFWGTPLNIWICGSCGNLESIGSIENLRERSKDALSEPLDLHKPFIDDVVLTCGNCGADMHRTPEVIDCWFDSGSMPFSQIHYPFEHKDDLDTLYPADFISEAVDQTRGWFYSLLAISVMLFDKPAYKSCLVMDLILDKEGQKMSKSRGNAVDPFEILDTLGADALRWYLISTNPPWIPTRFDIEGVTEVIRKFFGTLVNSYVFFATYANIDEFSYKGSPVPAQERPEIDRWLLSALGQYVEKVKNYYENYDITKAARSIAEFVIDDLSNWYVRLNRRRFWKSEKGRDKEAAYQTLYEALITLTKLIAPIAPFLSEELFRNLTIDDNPDKVSVHLEKFPDPEDPLFAYRDDNLVEKMDTIRNITVLGRSLRNQAGIKIRQPLPELLIIPKDDRQKGLIEQGSDFILRELNIKNLRFIDDREETVIKRAKPNFKALGAKLGAHMSEGKAYIENLTPKQINSYESGAILTITIDKKNYELTDGDLQIYSEELPGLEVVEDGGMTVCIDTNLTPELIREGFAREFVNRIQNMRKEAQFDVVDRIKMYIDAPEALSSAVIDQQSYIAEETLTTEISTSFKSGEFEKKLAFKEGDVRVGIERVS